MVKNLQHSASQRFTVNVKDYITTCCGPKALGEEELKPAHTVCVKRDEKMRTFLLRSVLSTFIFGLIFH